MTSLLPHTSPNINIALFIDIENLIGSASTLGIPIDVGPVLAKLKEQGRILVRRSYGDIKNCLAHAGRSRMEDQVRRMLLKNLVVIEDIPYMTASKNTADMRLVVDALAEAFTNSAISHFVVLSSDRDYIPLYNKLHELNKTVVAIVVDRVNVNSMVLEAADRVEYYETLVGAETEGDQQTSPVTMAMAAMERDALREEYFRVLLNAARALERKSPRIAAPQVQQMMQQLRSDFDPANIGVASFRDFLSEAEARSLIKVTSEGPGGDDILTITPAPPPAPATSALAAGASAPGSPPIIMPPGSAVATGVGGPDIKKLIKSYRKFIEEKIKQPLPTPEVRARIFAMAERSREELTAKGPFTLQEWADDIYATCTKDIEQNIIYKMLLSLHYARCFYCDNSGMPANPMIVGVKVSPDRWDTAVVANFIRQMATQSGWSKLDAGALAEVLYPGVPDGRRRIEEVLASR